MDNYKRAFNFTEYLNNEVRMAQNRDNSADKTNKTPRELFRARTATPPYRPDEADVSWLADMIAGDEAVRDNSAFRAAAEGNVWRLTQLLGLGVCADAEGRETGSRPGMSLLHIAVEQSCHAAAGFLLARGADANLPDESRGLPLVKAVRKGDVQMVCLLLHYNADPDAADGAESCARDLAQMNPVVKSILEETALPRRSGATGGQPAL
jgi:hypothetical protein